MKDQSILEAAGPLFIMACVAGVLAVTTWVMMEYQGDWGSGTPEAVAVTPADAH